MNLMNSLWNGNPMRPMASGSVSSMFNSMSAEIKKTLLSFVNSLLVPVGVAVCVVFIVVNAIKIAAAKREGGPANVQTYITQIVISAIVMAVLLIFSVWGAGFFR